MTWEEAATFAEVERALNRFDEAAQAWGWTIDQGTGSAIERDRSEYLAAKQDLIKIIREALK